MSVSIVLIPVIILMILVMVSIPVLLGVFVYQDAKARGMEPLLWALIAVLAPSLIGLIIYLVVRKDHVLLRCPTCGHAVQEGFVSCPNCGQKLTAGCRQCGAALRPEWKLCPQCGTEITDREPFISPVVQQNTNKKLAAVIIAGIVTPFVLMLVLVVIGLIGRAAFPNKDSFDEEFTSDAEMLVAQEFMDKADYYDYRVLTVTQSDLGPEVGNWVEQCRNGEEGIYSCTLYRTENGTFAGSLGRGDYEMDYAYTVLVLNDKSGAKYDDYGAEIYREGEESWLIVEDIVQQFGDYRMEESDDDRSQARKNAERYNNVFVIQHPVSYTIQYQFSVGKGYGLSAQSQSESMDVILNGGDGSSTHYSMTYTIPFDTDEDGYYTAFKKIG